MCLGCHTRVCAHNVAVRTATSTCHPVVDAVHSSMVLLYRYGVVLDDKRTVPHEPLVGGPKSVRMSGCGLGFWVALGHLPSRCSLQYNTYKIK